MNKCIIFRGISGSGKSSLAKLYSYRVCSADFYHMVDGIYEFKRENAGAAHNRCLDDFMDHLQYRSSVIVDNTNLAAYEYAPYYRLAEMYKYDVRIISILPNIEWSVMKNIHSVPIEVLQAQQRAWYAGIAEMPVWWKHEIITAEKVTQLLEGNNAQA